MKRSLIAATCLTAFAMSACGSSTSASHSPITLVVYDSFPLKDTSLNKVLASFSASTGIVVNLVSAGDAGTMVSKAVLTSGKPEGDVMWGVDNTLLSRALTAKVFEPYASKELGSMAPELTTLVPAHDATPVDFGDVCINYDIAWFTAHSLTPPASLADLTKPEYRNLLTVENPATSSTGLAFLLGTISALGDTAWVDYWKQLRANGVEVVDTWTTAYYTSFSGASGKGPRPIVVSYASSPPAEVIFADPPRTDAPTASVEATCFRQVEFAGVLRGAKHAAEAQQLVDFLAGKTFQSEVALNLFVYPARTDVSLPESFTKYSSVAAHPFTMAPDTIATNQQGWIDQWTSTVLR